MPGPLHREAGWGWEVIFTNEIHANHFVARRVLASGGEHRFDYDARGRIIEASTEAHEVRIAYDFHGYRLVDLRDGEGVGHTHQGSRSTVTRLFGRFPHGARFRDDLTELVDGTGALTIIEHGPSGLVKRRCGNGTCEVLQFNNAGQLEASLRYRNGRFGQPEGSAVRYTYTAEGDLAQVADSERGTTRYEFDSAHRLESEHTPNGRDYAYPRDRCYNLMSHPSVGTIELGTGNRLFRSTAEAFAYNSRDHLSERTSRTGSTIRYHYDSFDMLVRIECVKASYGPWPPRLVPPNDEGATNSPRDMEWDDWSAEYDALGRRLTTRWGGKQRQFFWDGDRLAAEIFPGGRLRIYQYASRDALSPLIFTDYPSRTAPAEAARSFHVFTNPVGIALSIEDADGKVVWRAERIDPYGTVELSTGSKIEYNLRWPGHYFDPETGLHYNRYRYYDPNLGRYLQSDPVGHQGSPINLYAYCANPTVQVDVLGLDHANKTDAADGSTEKATDVDGQEAAVAKKSVDTKETEAPTTEERALAASRGDTEAHREAREKVVRDFYGDRPGLGQARAEQDMGYGGKPRRANGNSDGYGIDLSKPLRVQNVPPPARVQQYVKDHGHPGNFCDPEGGQTPDALGLNGDPKARQPRTFDVPVTEPKQQGLVSGAGPVIDDWTDPSNPVSCKGGGTQMTIDNITKALLGPQPQLW